MNICTTLGRLLGLSANEEEIILFPSLGMKDATGQYDTRTSRFLKSQVVKIQTSPYCEGRKYERRFYITLDGRYFGADAHKGITPIPDHIAMQYLPEFYQDSPRDAAKYFKSEPLPKGYSFSGKNPQPERNSSQQALNPSTPQLQ